MAKRQKKSTQEATAQAPEYSPSTEAVQVNPDPPIEDNKEESNPGKDHLQWIYERLRGVFGDSETMDHMVKLREIIDGK